MKTLSWTARSPGRGWAAVLLVVWAVSGCTPYQSASFTTERVDLGQREVKSKRVVSTRLSVSLVPQEAGPPGPAREGERLALQVVRLDRCAVIIEEAYREDRVEQLQQDPSREATGLICLTWPAAVLAAAIGGPLLGYGISQHGEGNDKAAGYMAGGGVVLGAGVALGATCVVGLLSNAPAGKKQGTRQQGPVLIRQVAQGSFECGRVPLANEPFTVSTAGWPSEAGLPTSRPTALGRELQKVTDTQGRLELRRAELERSGEQPGELVIKGGGEIMHIALPRGRRAR